jgi:hypothetical protein
MKFEPLSHCPARAEAAVLRVSFGFGVRTRARVSSQVAGLTNSPAAAAPGFVARVRAAIAGLFRRDRHADARDKPCRCDIDARLLELETRKLDAQMLGGLRD